MTIRRSHTDLWRNSFYIPHQHLRSRMQYAFSTFVLPMQVKDYYKILELEPSANQQEIKKACRKLAQQNHPDKTNNDPYAAFRFSEIKEAYEVLANPAKKEFYFQQRWYHQGMGKKFAGIEPVTPPPC